MVSIAGFAVLVLNSWQSSLQLRFALLCAYSTAYQVYCIVPCKNAPSSRYFVDLLINYLLVLLLVIILVWLVPRFSVGVEVWGWVAGSACNVGSLTLWDWGYRANRLNGYAGVTAQYTCT